MRAEPQFIRAPGGDEMVVLTRADYDDLVARAAEADEDEADAALFDDRMADLKAGRDVVLPAEVTTAMLKGATLLRALRKWRGLTQVQLAEVTGLSQSYVSELEAQGGKGGTAEAWTKIAQALDVPLEWLCEEEAGG